MLNIKKINEILTRHGWFLSKCNIPFTTLVYLYDVVHKRVFYPKYEDVRLRPCPHPPPKEILLNKVTIIEGNAGITIGDSSKH